MSQTTQGRRRAAFTLIELLVVISIIAVLVSILMPSLAKAKSMAKQVTCLTRINGQMKGVLMYASEESDMIPAGPGFPMPLPGGASGPPLNSIASNMMWMGPAQCYSGDGILIHRNLVQPKMMFCPDDNSGDPTQELAKLEQKSFDIAYGSYMYRQYDGQEPGPTPRTRLSDLGRNAKGNRATAMLLDMNSLLGIPGAPDRVNHQGLKVSVAFADSHAATFNNLNGEMTLRPSDVMNMFGRIDEILEYADKLSQ